MPNDVKLFEIRTKHGTNTLERVPLTPPVARSRRANEHELINSEASEQLSIDEFAARMEQLLQQEQYGEVIYQTGENLKQDPSSAVLLHIKAVAHGLAHEHAIAYEHFRELADRYPQAAAGFYGMACALESMGDPDNAVPLLKRAYELEPNDTSILLNLGNHLARSPETRADGLTYLRKAERLGHRRARQIIDRIENE